jgi:hypothetical protein
VTSWWKIVWHLPPSSRGTSWPSSLTNQTPHVSFSITATLNSHTAYAVAQTIPQHTPKKQQIHAIMNKGALSSHLAKHNARLLKRKGPFLQSSSPAAGSEDGSIHESMCAGHPSKRRAFLDDESDKENPPVPSMGRKKRTKRAEQDAHFGRAPRSEFSAALRDWPVEHSSPAHGVVQDAAPLPSPVPTSSPVVNLAPSRHDSFSPTRPACTPQAVHSAYP